MRELARSLELAEHDSNVCGWTIWRGDEAVCIFGACHLWRGRAYLWSVFGEGSRSCMHGIIKAGKQIINGMAQHRIEFAVRYGFLEGIRLADILGFEFEYTADAYFPDGSDAHLFAKVRK